MTIGQIVLRKFQGSCLMCNQGRVARVIFKLPSLAAVCWLAVRILDSHADKEALMPWIWSWMLLAVRSPNQTGRLNLLKVIGKAHR